MSNQASLATHCHPTLPHFGFHTILLFHARNCVLQIAQRIQLPLSTDFLLLLPQLLDLLLLLKLLKLLLTLEPIKLLPLLWLVELVFLTKLIELLLLSNLVLLPLELELV